MTDSLRFILSFLKVIPPAAYLRVTENVHHIIPFIERIIENGHAYATKEGACAKVWHWSVKSCVNVAALFWNCLLSFAGNVYFDVGSIGGRYGKFGEGSDSPGEPGETSASID